MNAKRFLVVLILISFFSVSFPGVFAPKTVSAQLFGGGSLTEVFFDPLDLFPLFKDVVGEAANVAKNDPEAFAYTAIGVLITICAFDLFGLSECAEEYLVDVLGKAILRALVITMTNDIVNWINSGFEGEPIFPEDFETFLRDSADLATGIYLEDQLDPTVYAAICSPFQLEILINLFTFQVPRPACTLTDIIENVELMYTNIQIGGLASLVSISLVNNNNAFGSFLVRLDTLHARAIAAVDGSKTELQSSQGFIAFKTCVLYRKGVVSETGLVPVYERREEFGCEKYENQTPGALIVGSFDANTQAQMNELYLADSLNAITSALLSQLIIGPLMESLRKAPGTQEPNKILPLIPTKIILIEILDNIISSEQQFIASKDQAASIIDSLIPTIEDLEACDGTSRQTRIDELNALKSTILTEIGTAQAKIIELEDLKIQIDAEFDPTVLLSLETQVDTEQQNAKTNAELTAAETQAIDLQTELTTAQEDLAACLGI